MGGLHDEESCDVIGHQSQLSRVSEKARTSIIFDMGTREKIGAILATFQYELLLFQDAAMVS